MNLRLTAAEVAIEETGMTYADKAEFVEDVLRTWGEVAAQEVAAQYMVDLDALKRKYEGSAHDSKTPTGSSY